MRFGTSAGATFAAITVDVTCGAINSNTMPLIQSPLCPHGRNVAQLHLWRKGVGMINLLLFLIIGIFIAGQMVGRTPEYLGKKIGRAR